MDDIAHITSIRSSRRLRRACALALCAVMGLLALGVTASPAKPAVSYHTASIRWQFDSSNNQSESAATPEAVRWQ